MIKISDLPTRQSMFVKFNNDKWHHTYNNTLYIYMNLLIIDYIKITKFQSNSKRTLMEVSNIYSTLFRMHIFPS